MPTVNQSTAIRTIEATCRTKLLVVVDVREFVRGCLSFWLETLGDDFEVVGVPDIRQVLGNDQIGRATAVVFAADTQVAGRSWLEEQVSWLRSQQPTVPIAAILPDADDCAESLATRLSLQGYIPTSSSIDVAAAALRLIIAGGSYLRRSDCGEWRSNYENPAVPSPTSRIEPIEVAQILREVLSRLAPEVSGNLGRIRFALADGLQAGVDPLALRRILRDLIGTVLLMGSPTDALVTACRAGGSIEIAVTLDAVNENKASAGTTLEGLKTLMTVQGQTVEIDSRPDGAIVRVRLPELAEPPHSRCSVPDRARPPRGDR